MNNKMAIEKHCLSDALEGTSTHLQNVIKNRERKKQYQLNLGERIQKEKARID